MGAVGHYLLPRVGIKLEQLGGIKQAGITVLLTGFAQNKRRRAQGVPLLVHGHHCLNLLLQLLLQ